MRADADGSGVRRLTTVPGYDGGPFFSPDGKRIIWRRFDERGLIADVWTMNLDGTDQRQITNFGAMSWAPYIHPSGRYVLFASNKLGFENFEVFMVDIDGTKEPVRVTYSDGFDGLPVPSPDGTRLAWTSNRGGGREGQIFLAQWNHQRRSRAGRRTAATETDRICTMTIAHRVLAGSAPRSSCACPRRRRALGAAPAPRPQLRRRGPTSRRSRPSGSAGREAGSPGERLAADYIAAQLARLGARPLPGRADMFMPFEFTAGSRDGGSQHHASGTQTVRRAAATWSRSRSQTTATVSAPVVFAGYGIVVPESQNFGYDSYATLDVKDKVVVVLRYFPEDADKETKAILARYSDLRYKALAARQRGAKALSSSPGRARRTPARPCRSRSTRRSPVRVFRQRASAAKAAAALFAGAVARGRAEGAR